MTSHTEPKGGSDQESQQPLLEQTSANEKIPPQELGLIPPKEGSEPATNHVLDTAVENGDNSDKEKVLIDMDADDSEYDDGKFSRFVQKIEKAVSLVASKFETPITYGIKAAMFLAYLVYFSYCMHRGYGDGHATTLIVITVVIVLVVVKRLLAARGLHLSLPKTMNSCLSSTTGRKVRRVVRYALYLISSVGIIVFLAYDVLLTNPTNLQSFFGMFGLIFFSLLCSKKPSKVNWHPVFWGCIVQFGFAILTLKTQVGYAMFRELGHAIEDFINYSNAGSTFVLGKNFKTMGLAFSFAGVIIFFNAVMSLLTHWGVIEFVVVKLGYIMSLCLETGPVESVVATANIFIGLAEAPLLVRPYLSTVTQSEIHTIMTCGFASIAGATMGMFIRLGAPANHLLTAAVISAPAALAMSKLIFPETQKVDLSNQRNIKMRDSSQSRNALSACADGAVMAVKLLTSVMAIMLAFFSLLRMMNTFLIWLGQRAGFEGFTFELICSWVLFPVAYLMGVEKDDCGQVGALIGTKLFATPMIGYTRLGTLITNRAELEDYILNYNGTWHWQGQDVVLDGLNKTLAYGFISDRSEVISTYAMCGFSAFPAIGICLGTLASLCPARKGEIVEIVFRAFMAGNFASFLTGAVAGVMYTEK